MVENQRGPAGPYICGKVARVDHNRTRNQGGTLPENSTHS